MTLLKPLETKTSPFALTPKTNEPAHWVKPQLVAQVKFTEWTADGKLRHPVYLGLRDDKKAAQVTREKSEAVVRRSGFDVGRAPDAKAPKAAKLEKERLTAADSVAKKVEGKDYVDPKFEVPFTVASAGKTAVEAKMTFFICPDKVCARQQTAVSWPVDVS